MIVRTQGDERAIVRLRAELRASAWQVVELGPDDQTDHAALSELAARYHASAALRLRPALAEMELWAAGSARRAGVETLSGQGPRMDDAVLALRAAEALRAMGLSVDRPGSQAGGSGQAASSEPQPTAATAAEQQDDASTPADDGARSEASTEAEEAISYSPPLPRISHALWLQLGPALGASPGGVPLTLDGWLGVRVQPQHAWSISLAAIEPLSSARVRAAEGSARVAPLIVALAADAQLDLAANWLSLSLGAGFAAVACRMHGSARAPYQSADSTVWVAAPLARASLSLALSAGLHLLALGELGASVPQISVRFGPRDAAQWGRPFLTALLGFEAALWSRP